MCKKYIESILALSQTDLASFSLVSESMLEPEVK